MATVEGLFDSTLKTQEITHGQHNSKNRPLSKTNYGKVKDVWSELPIGRHRAEMGAWVNRKMSGAGATAEDMTKLEGLKRLLEAIPEESDWHYIDVYLHCRVEGGRVRLSQEQKEAIGDVNKVKAITKCDEFTTFGKRGGSITEHTTAVELLEGHASPPRGSWGVTSKCISFAQDLAKDVHNTKKVYVTREAAGQFMRRFGEEVENGRETTVRHSYEALGPRDTPMKRMWDNTGGAMVSAAKKLFTGGDNQS